MVFSFFFVDVRSVEVQSGSLCWGLTRPVSAVQSAAAAAYEVRRLSIQTPVCSEGFPMQMH